jgi:hypothetical protein
MERRFDGNRSAVRPVIAHTRWATCWQPYVKGLTIMSKSTYNML